MKTDATALANYFILKAMETKSNMTMLRLLKLVYIAHGFLLARLDRNCLNERFDVVEAWKFGPVIPSLYHSFKHNGNNSITELGKIVCGINNDGELEMREPKVENEKELEVLEFVWNRYFDWTTTELVDFVHQKNSPWAEYYKPHKNVVIPDAFTKLYFELLCKYINNENE